MENISNKCAFDFPEDYLFHYLDTPDHIMLDAGCGLGTTTFFVCQRIVAEGGSGRIISVDKDKDDLFYAKKRIGNLAHLVTFVNEDLIDMSSIASESIDAAFFVNTLSWLEMSPLKTVLVLKELKRILKKGGRLSVHDQYINNDTPSIWAKAWTLYKALNHLEGKEHLVEISPEYLAQTLSILSFHEIEYQKFPSEQIPIKTTIEFLDRLIERCKNAKQLELALPMVQALKDVAQDKLKLNDLSLPTYVLHCKV